MKTREKFQPVTDGRNEIFEVFRKKQGDLDIIGVERQGLIYYIILLGGFNSHKAWVSIMMDGEMKSILDGFAGYIHWNNRSTSAKVSSAFSIDT